MPLAAHLDAQRDGPARRGEDVEVGRATSSSSPRRSTRYGPEAVVAFLASGHYRQPLAFSDELLEESAARVERIRELRSRCAGRRADPFVAERREAFLDALADDFNTPAGVRGARRDRRRGQPPRAARRPRRARGAAAAARPRLAAGRGGRRRPRGRELLAEREAARAGEGLRARRRDPRRAGRAGLGGPRRGRAAPAWSAAAERCGDRRRRVHLRPPPGGRGRARPPRGPPRLAGARDAAGRARAPLRVARPPGRRRRGRSLPYADPTTLLARRGRAGGRARPDPGPPQPRGGLPRAEVAGRDGVVIPERRAAAVTPAACKASAGAVEHLPVARVRNLADWLAEAKEQGAWSTAPPPARAATTPRSTGRGGRSW